MIEVVERRLLGALRWIDAVSLTPIRLSLVVTSPELRFTRNLGGLTVISTADGLENYARTFDLADLPAADVVLKESFSRSGVVSDPSGTYLPTRFTIKLPRDESPALLPPDNHRPPGSLFSPIDIVLLPSPAARVPPGAAQVRVRIRDAGGVPRSNVLARVVATPGNTVLGYGLSDARGETLVAIPGLKYFAPGATEHEVVTLETEARLEIVPPPAADEIIDWTTLKDVPVAAGDTDPVSLKLRPGGLYSRQYPF